MTIAQFGIDYNRAAKSDGTYDMKKVTWFPDAYQKPIEEALQQIQAATTASDGKIAGTLMHLFVFTSANPCMQPTYHRTEQSECVRGHCCIWPAPLLLRGQLNTVHWVGATSLDELPLSPAPFSFLKIFSLFSHHNLLYSASRCSAEGRHRDRA